MSNVNKLLYISKDQPKKKQEKLEYFQVIPCYTNTMDLLNTVNWLLEIENCRPAREPPVTLPLFSESSESEQPRTLPLFPESSESEQPRTLPLFPEHPEQSQDPQAPFSYPESSQWF